MKRMLLVAIVLLSACGQQLPRPECDPAESLTSALQCEDAVRAALGALPANHPTITRIQFAYGSLTPGSRLPAPGEEQPDSGIVIFTWADGSRRQYVQLIVYRGALTVGAPTPY